MIPVFQTRYSVETVGNCWEACIASILELPLSAIPDRADYVEDLDAWADHVHQTRLAGGANAVGDLEVPWSRRYDDDLQAWLEARGLGFMRWDFEGPARRHREGVLWTLRNWHKGLWIGSHVCGAMSHAVVYDQGMLVHNPWPEAIELGELIQAEVFTAASPRMIVRELGPELLPDVKGKLERLPGWKVVAGVDHPLDLRDETFERAGVGVTVETSTHDWTRVR